MRLAKNYQQYETIGDPYQAHRHWYQKININGQITEARLYTDDEYDKMYPPNLTPIKEQLGFDKGPITLISGNTKDLTDWLTNIGAQYHKLFGWYLTSAAGPIDPIPEGITLHNLEWAKISVNNKYLRPDQEIVEIVSSIKYGLSPSQFVGEIGSRITVNLHINKVVKLNTRYGETNLYIMEDPDENIYTWITNSRNLVEGQTYAITGTIKAHETYKGQKRNVITRCQVQELKEK